jgi:cellulose synthase/poly-beta-1,6-N-acetylglucosamine synthase-like glycosyltransferase
VVLRDTDTDTIRAATKVLDELNRPNIKIKLISGEPYNKPHHLNAALQIATKDIICIFDAEDEPHHEIYDVVNTVMLRDQADVVQCGVQLMNFESNWYSLFNVLEYFLWFGSALHFYERQGIVPLGGNTVFFKTQLVRQHGGWDLEGLTEDAEIGIRMSSHGAKIRVVYDPKHATQEETPPTLQSFIKQRTRWSQGFLQILAKRRALRKELPALTFKRELLTLYILGWPRIHAFMFLYIPIAFILSFFVKMHLAITIITIMPMLLLGVYLVVQNIALYEFTTIYRKRWRPQLILKTIVWFFPYQFILSLSSFRAMVRQFKQQTSWEKTEHVNAHRLPAEIV